jgi:hypothetical protein
MALLGGRETANGGKNTQKMKQGGFETEIPMLDSFLHQPQGSARNK